MHMLDQMNEILFSMMNKTTNQLNEIVLMKQIEFVVRKLNVNKDVTSLPDPIEKT